MTYNKHMHRHGHCAGGYSPTYRCWSSLKTRCTNPKNKRHADYASRWYPPWADFAVFLADMGERPEGAHSIERKDNALPYGPGNCVWAMSAAEQARNSSVTKLTLEQAAAIRASNEELEGACSAARCLPRHHLPHPQQANVEIASAIMTRFFCAYMSCT